MNTGQILTQDGFLHHLMQQKKALEQKNILIFGDVMLDEYLHGSAERISPEAPVPVVRVNTQKHVLGGAGNVAKNICAFLAKPTIVAVKGSDAAGSIMADMVHQEGIVASFIETPKRPTTIKTRILASGQQMLRFDKEDSSPLSTTVCNALFANIVTHLASCSAIIVSDYGKGVITRKSMELLLRYIQKNNLSIPVLVDPKPQNILAYKGVTLLTPNSKEAGELVNLPTKSKPQIIKAGKTLMQKLGCPQLIITMGGEGMAVFESKETVWHISTVAQNVFDVTGAGDTVIATLSLGLTAGLSLVESALLANYTAGIVVGHVGAATATFDDTIQAITSLPFSTPKLWQE